MCVCLCNACFCDTEIRPVEKLHQFQVPIILLRSLNCVPSIAIATGLHYTRCVFFSLYFTTIVTPNCHPARAEIQLEDGNVTPRMDMICPRLPRTIRFTRSRYTYVCPVSYKNLTKIIALS